MDIQPRHIGIFGGTFDPVHNGHISIAKSFLQSNFIDELWIFLSPFPPHKENEEFAPYGARFRMLQAAFSELDDVKVSDLETSLPTPSYTIQTVKYLTKVYPEYSFYLCMGKDSLLSFDHWYKWENILEYCMLLVADRPLKKNEIVKDKILQKSTFVDHEPISISSTEIRTKVKRGKPVNNLVPLSVLQLLKNENLYKD